MFLLFSKCKAFIHYSKEIYDDFVNKNEPFELSDQGKVEEIEASTIMKNVAAYEEKKTPMMNRECYKNQVLI